MESRKSLQQLIMAYLDVFGNKYTCSEDLAPYVSAAVLEDDERNAVLEVLNAHVSDVRALSYSSRSPIPDQSLTENC